MTDPGENVLISCSYKMSKLVLTVCV